MAKKLIAEASTSTLPETSEKETEFNREILRKNSRSLFGVKPEIFDGALHANKKEKLTKSEVKQLIEDFLKKEVK